MNTLEYERELAIHRLDLATSKVHELEQRLFLAQEQMQRAIRAESDVCRYNTITRKQNLETATYERKLAAHKTTMAASDVHILRNALAEARKKEEKAVQAKAEAYRALSLARGYSLIEENS